MHHHPFSYENETAFFQDLKNLTKGIPYSKDTSILNMPLQIGTRTIPNRLTAQPVECSSSASDGAPSSEVMERYTALARGGSGIIWLESTAINSDGRTNRRQLWLHQNNVPQFASLADAIHSNGCSYLVMQLTHAGRNSNADSSGRVPCVFDNPYITKENGRIITDEELEEIKSSYVKTAILAETAGFDAVDIRVCHGYLLNELLAARERSGKYGGSYENRVKLIFEIIEEIKALTNIDVCVRLNMYDALPYPYGWGCEKTNPEKANLSEPLRLIRELANAGISVLNISAGIGAVSPHIIRPYDKGGPIPAEHPLESVERLLQFAKQAKTAAPDVPIVASGFTWLRNFAPNVAAGGIGESWFDLAGFGRQSIIYPGYANDILNHTGMQKLCVTCGGCTALLKRGKPMHCIHS